MRLIALVGGSLASLSPREEVVGRMAADPLPGDCAIVTDANRPVAEPNPDGVKPEFPCAYRFES